MRRLWWALLLLMGLSGAAQATCTVTLGNAAFGSRTASAINAAQQNTSANLQLNCTTALALLTNDSVTMTYQAADNSSGNRALLKNTANSDTISLILCTQINCASPGETAIGGSYTWNASTLLGLLSGNNYTLPLYLFTVAGQNISAGTYQATLTLRINYSICQTGAAGVCLSAQTGTQTLPMVVTLSVSNDCNTIVAPTVSFGSAPLVKNFNAISQSIAITCSKGSVYTVGLNNGSYANGNVRNMASGNNRLSYEIYKENSTSRWGVSGSERWASAASSLVSADGLLRTFNYTARVLTTQTTPAVGSYSDTVVVDVAF